ncbi:translation factor GUF1, mitochondrial [Acrasis kona]|uniref:Translation factor GUF1 homolog, mitochondrial n=1 Tax=Acrasis kona TaxID=1008807 RepID=A0AAW2ZRS5_9EUKA
MSKFPPELIRNFSIIAHIDHGKSTLADRLLEETGVLTGKNNRSQFLDKLKVEQERGITVKAQTCAMFYTTDDGKTYLLNLIDTPGHVDFNYEVSRSLAACSSVLLLVDSSQGVQAQTLANYYLAIEQDLTIIPIMTKIDQQSSQPDVISAQMEQLLGVENKDILPISAKTGINCDQVIPRIIENGSKPSGLVEAPLKALLFDSWYDEYFGVICMVYVVDGQLKIGQTLISAYTKKAYEILQVGIMHPEQVVTNALFTGQVGYIVCNMRTAAEARVGDTLYRKDQPIDKPLPGFKPAKPMVFAGVFPLDSENDFDKLKDTIEKLCLTDSSVHITRENSGALGMGFRCGFLGLLHMDVFKQRLEQEFGTETIITTPTVVYKVAYADGKEKLVENPNEFPDSFMTRKNGLSANDAVAVYEPIVVATIVCPEKYFLSVINLCNERRGEQKDIVNIDEDRVSIHYIMPLNEIIHDFFDRLKSLTQGYATLDYEESGYQQTEMVKLNVMINKESVDALSFIVPKDQSQFKAREIVEKLRKQISRQMYEVSIQCAVGVKVIASETLKAFRKDVTAKCYGGDITRKRKLLDKQKEGKKKMKQIGSVHIPQEAFLSVFKVDDGK